MLAKSALRKAGVDSSRSMIRLFQMSLSRQQPRKNLLIASGKERGICHDVLKGEIYLCVTDQLPAIVGSR